MVSVKARQVFIFGLAWSAYASTYLLRKSIGVIKADLHLELKFSNKQLGMLDTALLLPYAFAQMLLGTIGDKFGPRQTFGTCLIIAALSMCSFGHFSSLWIFMMFLFINGFAQSQCWPNCSKALGNWFADNTKDRIFGLFGTCAFVGGIVGSGVAVALQAHYGWRACFLVPAVVVAVFGIVVLLFFKQPADLNIEIPGKAIQSGKGQEQNRPSLREIVKIPTIPEVAISMFCLKIVRYTMYMWLPLYLLYYLNYSKVEAGMYATVFEIGGVVGSALIGFVIDRVFHGRTLYGVTWIIILSMISLAVYKFTSRWGVIINCICMFLAGAFNCGPDMLLGGSFPAVLGEMDGRNAAAAVVGFINGFGSVGTVLEGPVIGFVADQFGWSGMFFIMVGLTFIAVLSTAKACRVFESLPHNRPAVTLQSV